VWLDPVVGREYSGRRPAVVVATEEYLSSVEQLVVIVPITTTNRGWPNHVPITPTAILEQRSWAVTEQPRTISRDRIVATGAVIDEACQHQIDEWLSIFLHV